MASVRIQGLDQIVANLRALPAELAGKNGGPIREAIAACARVVRDDARTRAPYNAEGFGKHLRDEIIMKRDPNPRAVDNAAERYIVTVKYRAKKYANTRRNRNAGRTGTKSLLSSGTYQNFGDFYYWRFVEFGTSRMPQRSFLRASFEANKDALTGIAVAKLSASIARIVRGMPK